MLVFFVVLTFVNTFAILPGVVSKCARFAAVAVAVDDGN